MPALGDGYRVHVTGLTHDERGYPVIDAATQRRTVPRLVEKINRNAERIIEVERTDMEGADAVIVCYGISARSSLGALRMAQEKGLRVGMLRLITVWPFPETILRELAETVRGFIVPEINLGQIVREVERAVGRDVPVRPVSHAGGGIHDPNDIVRAVEEVVADAA
jgi:2-oxoglutarate ferredoxin oxidoreductase subunit alpha